MKKMLIALAITGISAYAVTSEAYTISYAYKTPLPQEGGYASVYTGGVGVQTETFDNTSLLWTWSVSPSSDSLGIVSGSLQNNNAAPSYYDTLAVADATKYLSVPVPATSGTHSATATLGADYNYFGLWWGSVDSYNSIKFYDNGSEVAAITGTQAAAPAVANGSWTSAMNNMYISFYDLPEFDSFQLISSGIAFEVDNITVASNVPEPGTFALLGAGLVGLGFFARRRKSL